MIVFRISLSAVLLAAACRSATVAPAPTPGRVTANVPPELESQQKSWDQLGIRDYSFTYQPYCMCAGFFINFHVEVSDGKVVSVQSGSQPLSLSSRDVPRPTIDSLFAWLRNAYVRKAAAVRATYDPRLHFPANVSIDWDLNMIDDEFSFEVMDLRPTTRVRHPQR